MSCLRCGVVFGPHERTCSFHTMKVYIIGSLRNPNVPVVGNALRAEGLNAFDDWYGSGEKADEAWQAYEKQRGRGYVQALQAPAARNTFEFDRRHILSSDAVVLVAPAGRSGHLELGWALGKGIPGYILLDGEPERYDVMYLFATAVFTKLDNLVAALREGL